MQCATFVPLAHNDLMSNVQHRVAYPHDDVIKWTHFPRHWPFVRVTRSYEVFFDLCLNKRLSNQSRGRLFEPPSRPLWRHCNVMLEPYLNLQWRLLGRVSHLYLRDRFNKDVSSYNYRNSHYRLFNIIFIIVSLSLISWIPTLLRNVMRLYIK